MAPIIIPIALSVATAGVGFAVGAVSAAAAVFSVAATAVAAGYSYLTTPHAQGVGGVSPTPLLNGPARFSDGGGSAALAGFAVNEQRPYAVRQPTPPRRFAYGRLRVGGAVLYQDTANPYLLVITALSDGTISEIEKLYLGEDAVTVDGSGDAISGTRFYQRVKVELSGTGADSQTRSALAVATVTTLPTSFKQSGIARGVVRLDWGPDASTHNYVYGTGVEPAFLVKGVKVYDPREAGHDVNDPDTWAYSDNPALCVAHAIITAWGVALDPAKIDWDSVAAAADVCDESISFGSSSFSKFTLAGVFQSDQTLAAQVAQMLTAFDGIISYSDGLYSIKASEAASSVTTFTDDDIIGIEDFAHEMPAASLFTAIKATYYDADTSGRKLMTPVIDLTTSLGETVVRETAVDLPFTPKGPSAQILAYRRLRASRSAVPLSIRLRDCGVFLDAGDVFTIQSDTMPFLDGDWRAVQIDLAGVGCIVAARRYVANMYADPTTYLV